MKYLRRLLCTPFAFIGFCFLQLGAVIYGDPVAYGLYVMNGFGVHKKELEGVIEDLKDHIE